MRDKLIIYGAGGFGKEILALAEKKYKVLGFIDDIVDGTVIGEYEVIGNCEWLLKRTHLTNVVVCIANVYTRKKIVERLKENNNIVFPRALTKPTLTF